MLENATTVLTIEIDRKKKEYERLIKLESETSEFFRIANKLSEQYKEYTETNLVTPGFLTAQLSLRKEKILSTEEILNKRKEYHAILDSLEIPVRDTDTEQSILIFVRERTEEEIRLLPSFSVQLLARKFNSLKSILGNKDYIYQNEKLQKETRKQQELLQKKSSLKQLYEKADKRADAIRKIIGELQENEYNNVGPYLKRLYKKLARIDTIQEVCLTTDGKVLSLMDEKGKNIVNILSNGQLSVFMLAFFFAGIIYRKNKEACKIYFIDDLTACLDDVNMLSFLDLMKYQMLEENGCVEQLFFASCDERICNLLKYKLEGSNIMYCEINERDFQNNSEK